MKNQLIAASTVTLAMFIAVSTANATLVTIGTATYSGSDYKLIYDVDGQITWLDYSNSGATYSQTVTWVSSLDAALTINLNEGYSASWDDAKWRLPEVYGSGNNPTNINFTGSEMSDLYYSELGNELNDASLNFGDFDNMNSSTYAWYFLDPEPGWDWDPAVGSFAPYFSWGESIQADRGDHQISTNSLNGGVYGMAIISGEVSMVPVFADGFE